MTERREGTTLTSEQRTLLLLQVDSDFVQHLRDKYGMPWDRREIDAALANWGTRVAVVSELETICNVTEEWQEWARRILAEAKRKKTNMLALVDAGPIPLQ